MTYTGFVCKERPKKTKEQNRTKCIVWGNFIYYSWDMGTQTAEMLLVKIFLNSVILTGGAKFVTINTRNFYLGTPKRKIHILKLAEMPQEIVDGYKLHDLVTLNGWVYIELSCEMYVLPQSESICTRTVS